MNIKVILGVSRYGYRTRVYKNTAIETVPVSHHEENHDGRGDEKRNREKPKEEWAKRQTHRKRKESSVVMLAFLLFLVNVDRVKLLE